jgi:hypothetical protein
MRPTTHKFLVLMAITTALLLAIILPSLYRVTRHVRVNWYFMDDGGGVRLNQCDDVFAVPTNFTGVVLGCGRSGQPIELAHYTAGKRHGISTSYHKDGNLYRQAAYANGVLQGTVTWWYPSGVKELEEEYEDGKSTGVSTSWYGDATRRWVKRDGRVVEWGDSSLDAVQVFQEFRNARADGTDIPARERVLRFVKRGMRKERVRDLLGSPVAVDAQVPAPLASPTVGNQSMAWEYTISRPDGYRFYIVFDDSDRVQDVLVYGPRR